MSNIERVRLLHNVDVYVVNNTEMDIDISISKDGEQGVRVELNKGGENSEN